MKAGDIVTSVFGSVFKIVFIIIVVILIYKVTWMSYDYGMRIFAEPAMVEENGKDVEVTIAAGKSIMEIGKILEEAGLIRDAKLFWMQEKLSGNRGKLQPGEYVFNTSMLAEDMMDIMAQEDMAEAKQ